MALKIRINAELADRQEWEEFVNQHPEGNVFQMPWMYDVYRLTHKQKPFAFFAYDEKKLVGVLVGVYIWNSVFPLSWFTRRQIIVGGPLVLNNDIGIVMALVDALVHETGEKAVYTEVRNLRLGLSLKPSFQDAGFIYESYLGVGIDMNRKSGELWDSLSPDRKQNIKKMAEVDYYIKDLSDSKDVRDAWNIIRFSIGRCGRPGPQHSLIRSALKSPELESHLRIKGLMISNVLKAVILIITFKNGAYLWYSGNCLSSENKWMRDGLLWEVIQELQGQGIRHFNLGPAGRPGKDFFVRQYKKSYGGMIKETGRYIYVHNWFLWNLGNIFYRWYKKVKKLMFKNICRT